MTPDEQRRLMELFEACSLETLTDSEHRELEAALHGDAEIRRMWFLHHDLELGLKRLAHVPDGDGGLPEEIAPVSNRPASTNVGRGSRSSTSGRDPSRFSVLARRSAKIAALALLCMSAIVMFGFHFWRQPPAADHDLGIKIDNESGDGFTVESPTHGSKFTLSEQKGKVVALHFLLKTECPFCLKLTHDYAKLAATTPDVVHVFLKPDSADQIKAWAAKLGNGDLNKLPVIYRDPDAKLADEFGIPDGYKFHGQTIHYPALVLLDRAGKELFRYVGKSNADRMTPADFSAKLAAVIEKK